jgi:hypothetical protein
MERVAVYRLNGYVTGISMNESGDRLGVVSVESQNNIWVTKVTVIRVGNRITESTAAVEGTLGSTCGFITEDRFAVLFSDRLMVFAGDATVMGEKSFEGSTPTLAAIGRGSVAILSRESDGLSSSVLTVYDRNAREDYRLELPSDHPISQAGDPTTLCCGGNALYMRAGNTLFRVAGSGRSITSLSVSRDTLNILPLNADEALVCTPAYAYRVESKDFH